MSLRFVLLALLSKEPDTGYGMGRLLHNQLNHLWNARLQQIYGELAKLESEGLVVSESFALPNRPAKKVYTLTPPGNDALDHWLIQPPTSAPPKNNLLVRLYCLDRIPKEVILQRLKEQQEMNEDKVHKLRDSLADAEQAHPKELGRLLTLEAAISHGDAEATWCAKAISTIERTELTPSSKRRAASRGARA